MDHCVQFFFSKVTNYSSWSPFRWEATSVVRHLKFGWNLFCSWEGTHLLYPVKQLMIKVKHFIGEIKFLENCSPLNSEQSHIFLKSLYMFWINLVLMSLGNNCLQRNIPPTPRPNKLKPKLNVLRQKQDTDWFKTHQSSSEK